MNSLAVGITGSRGFIASHLMPRIEREPGWSVIPCDREAFADPVKLAEFVSRCDAIVHLAGMNRGPADEVYEVNVSLARQLVAAMVSRRATPLVLTASSTQECLDNAYGRSKRAAAKILGQWSAASGTPVTVEVIPNVYGAGCRPFYNSVVSTFCHQLAVGEQPRILEDREIELICVSELIEALIRDLRRTGSGVLRHRVQGTSRLRVSGLLEILQRFRASCFESKVVPDLTNPTERNLYTTFLSYLPSTELCHRPPIHSDERGNLVEVIKTMQGGQVFFSTTKPGVTRGDHYHTRKVEWFCVLKGQAVIRLRRLGTQRIQEFHVDGERPEFVSIPIMQTHHIQNVGNEDLLTMFWCNEIFDAQDSDTFYEAVTQDSDRSHEKAA